MSFAPKATQPDDIGNVKCFFFILRNKITNIISVNLFSKPNEYTCTQTTGAKFTFQSFCVDHG